MIRLNMNVNNSDLDFVFDSVGECFIPTNKDQETYEYMLNKTSDYLEAYPTVTDYRKFISLISKQVQKSLDGRYFVFEDNGIFYVLFSYNSNQYNYTFSVYIHFATLVVKYDPGKLLGFTEKLFGFSDDKKAAVIQSSSANNFNFITTWQVLSVIFAKANIESNGEVLFEEHKKAKKSGGYRTYYAPNEEIKTALQKLNVFFQKIYDNRNGNIQIAYKKKKNVKTGALKHKDNKYIFNLDLHDFYPSCKKELVKKYTDFLFSFSYNRDFVEEQFYGAILINDGLFIGSPVSGTLANAIISMPVKYMNTICKKYGMVLTVYADDISVSSQKPIARKFVENIFKTAFAKYGLENFFSLNDKKAVGFSGCNRKVTGVSINNDNKVTVPRTYYRDLRAQLANLAYGKGTVAVNKLRGKIAYALMIDDSGKMYRYLNKFLETVKQYNLCSDEKLEELEKKFGGK